MARPPSSTKSIGFEPIDFDAAFAGVSKTSDPGKRVEPLDLEAAFTDLTPPEPLDLEAAFAGVKFDREAAKAKFDEADRAKAEENLKKEGEGWRWPWEVATDAVKGAIGTVAGTAGDVVGAMNKDYGVPFGGEISAAAGLLGRAGWDDAQDLSDALEAQAQPKSEYASNFTRNASEIQEAMNQGQTAQRQLAKQEMGEAMRGGILSTAKHLALNPLDVAETTVESLPLMGVGKVVGAGTRGLTGVRAAEVPAMLAAEGGMSVASSVQQAREAIRTLPPEKLAALPDYGPLVEKYGDEGARKVLEGRAATQAGFAAIVLQTAVGVATRRFSAVEEAMAGNTGPTSSRAANASIAVPKEFAQEGFQGGSEALGANFGVSAADPSRGLMDGVVEGALVEGAASVPLSGGLGALQKPKDKTTPAPGITPAAAPPPTPAEIMASDLDPASKGVAVADAVLRSAGVAQADADLDARLDSAIAAADAAGVAAQEPPVTVDGASIAAPSPSVQPQPRSFAERRAGARSLAQVSQLVAGQGSVAQEQPLPTQQSSAQPTKARAVDYNAPESQDLPNFGMPELTRALPDEHPLMQPRDKDASPERVAMRQTLIDQRLQGRPSAPEGVKPIAYVMGGGGASGKGTVLHLIEESEGATRDKYVHLDPDSFKTGDEQHGLDGIPEYAELIANGEKRAAGIVHEESSNLYKDALNQAIGKRQNLVLDRTLSDEKKALAELQSLKDAGYEIRMVGVTVDPREAISRSVLRAEGKAGRYVPLAALIKAHKGFSLGFENIQKLADRVVLYDNGVAKGESPIPIAERSGDGSLTILDRARYNQFVSKGGINEQATNYRELGYALAPEADGGDVQARGDAQGDQGARRAGQPDSSPAQEDVRSSPSQVGDNARPDPAGRTPDQGGPSAAVGEKPAATQEVPQPVAAGEAAGKGAVLPDSPKVRRGLGVTSKLDAITRAVERFAAGLSSDLKVKVLNNLQEVPGFENREDVSDGMYHEGVVYLFADELPENDVARWSWVFAHEAKGHAGLRGLLGKDLDTALERAARNPFVADLAAAIQKDRDGDGLTKLEATEEALSEIQGAIETNGFEDLADRYKVDITPIREEKAKTTFQKFVETIKSLFKAKTNTEFSTGDVLKLLDAATAAVGGKGKGTAFSTPRRPKTEGDRFVVSDLPKGSDAKVNAVSLVDAFDRARSKKYKTNRDLKNDLQEASLEAQRTSGVDLQEMSRAAHTALTNAIVADAKFALKDNANAVGWYDRKVSEAMSVLSLLHPEIATDKESHVAFVWALATTSNGNKVDKNFELAEKAYAEWKETGRMPAVGIGTAANAINSGMELFNRLSEKMSPEALERMLVTKFTVAEIERATGVSPGGEWKSTDVRGAAMLGPKVGNGFLANLLGKFDALTIDRWFMRTWGRLTGSLIEIDEARVQHARTRLAITTSAMNGKERATLVELVGEFSTRTNEGTDALATAINKASAKKDKREQMQKTPRLDEARRIGNSLHMLRDGQKEAPDGPMERTWIRTVMDSALKKLSSDGNKMEMADLQALLWYPEKRLYDSAKSPEDAAAEEAYADEDAPDYSNAAVALAKSRGIEQGKIDNALKNAPKIMTGEMSAKEKAEFLKSTIAPPEQGNNVLFEVAPDPSNAELLAQWQSIPEKTRVEITREVGRDAAAQIAEAMGLAGISKPTTAVGGFENTINPNQITEYSATKVSVKDALAFAASVGKALDQASMVVIDGRLPDTVPTIRLRTEGKEASKDAEKIWNAITEAEPELKGSGFTARGDVFEFLNFTGIDSNAIAKSVQSAVTALGISGAVSHGDIHSTLLERSSYDSHIEGLRPRVRKDVVARIETVRANAQGRIADAAREYGAGAARRGDGDAKFSKPRSNAAGNRRERSGAATDGAESQAVGWNERPVQPDAARVEGIHYSNTSGLSALDGKKHGTNHRGAEFKRLARAEGKRFASILKRVYFYVAGTPQARGESVVGREAVYGQTLENLYDLAQDSRDYKGAFDNIKNDSDWINEIEAKIVADGFDGWVNDGVAVVLGTKPVPVREPKFSKPKRDPKEQAEADGFDTSKVYYHGTTAAKDFKTFRPGKGGVNELGPGVYVTDQKMYAEMWARGDGGRVLPLWLKKGDIYDLDMHKRKAGLPEALRDVWIPLAKRIRERPELSSELQRTWDEAPIEEHAERLREIAKSGALNETLERAGYIGAKNEYSQIPGQVVLFAKGSIRSAETGKVMFSKPAPGQVTAKDREDLRQQARAIAKSVDIASSDIEDVANRNMRLAKLSQDAADKIAEWTESDQLTAAVRDAKEIESDLAKAATNEDYSQGARREALRARDAIVGELSGLRTALAAAKKAGADAIKLQDRAAKLGQPIDATQMAEYRALLIEAADQAATAYDYVRKVMAARRAHESSVFKAKQKAADKRDFVSNQLGARQPLTFSYTDRFDDTVRGSLRGTRERYQDKYLSLLFVQQDIEAARGKPLDDVVNAYRNENLMHGRAGDRVEHLKSDHVDPLIKAMKEAKVDPTLLEDYLEARYAETRNKLIAARNPGMQDGGSGMLTQDARDFLAGKTAGHRSGVTPDADTLVKLKALAKRVDAIRTSTLQSLVADGLITQDQADNMIQDHPNYAPLRGKDGEEVGMPGTGKGIDVRGKFVKTAMGRGEGNRAVNILSEIFKDAETSIFQGEKNRVAKSLALLALENPNPDLWTLEPVVTEAKLDSLGQVYQSVKSNAQDQDSIRVMVKGRAFYVKLTDKRLRDAFKNLGADQSNAYVQFLGALNRYASATLTRYNPSFVAVNMVRDAIFGFTGIASEHGLVTAGKAAANYGPAAKALFLSQTGKPGSGRMDAIAKEWAQAGGKTAFGGINSVEETSGMIEAEFRSMREMIMKGQGGIALRSRLGNMRVIKIIEGANDIAENAIRLATYATLREQGMSVAKAAEYAKNLTVNFNRRGSKTTVANAIILFFNASVQGAHRNLRLLSNPKVKGAMGALTATSFVLATLAMGADDEDEDGLTAYEKMSDNDKERNILIPIVSRENGRTKVTYVKIPMPYGFNVFSHLGGRMAELMMGNKYTVGKFVNDNASVVVGAFSPLKFQEGVDAILPFYVNTLTNLKENKDDLGMPIRQEDAYSKFEKPRAFQGKSDTPVPFQMAAKALNAIGGGDRYTPPKHLRGLLDWAPEDLEYLTGQLTGGAGRFVTKSFTAGQKMFAGVEMNPSDVPILSSFIGEVSPEKSTQNLFYDRRAKIERELEKLRDVAREEGVAAAKDLIEKTPELEGVKLHRFATGRLTNAAGAVQLEAKKGSSFKAYKDADKAVKAIRQEIESVRSAGLPFAQRVTKLKELEKRREAAQREFTVASANWKASGE